MSEREVIFFPKIFKTLNILSTMLEIYIKFHVGFQTLNVCIRPAVSPDLDRRLPAFSLLYRLSGFHVKISCKIIKFPAFVFFGQHLEIQKQN